MSVQSGSDTEIAQIGTGAPLLTPNLEFQSEFERKIRIVFSGVYLKTLIYVIAAISVFIVLKSTQEDLLEKHVKTLFIMKDLEISIQGSVSAARGYLLTGDNRFLIKLEDQQKKTHEFWNRIKLQKKIEDRKKLLEQIERHTDLYSENMAQLIEMKKRGGGRGVLLTFFEGKVIPSRELMKHSLNEFEDIILKEYQKSELHNERVWLGSLILFILAGVLSALVFLTVFRILTKLLKRQRAAELAFAASERLSRQAIDLTGLGIFNHDQKQEVIFWSSNMKKICGMPENENYTLDDWIELVHPEDRSFVVQSIRKAHDPEGSGLYDCQHRLVLQGGQIRWVMIKSQTFFEILNHKRYPIRTIGIILDITKIKETEISLRKALDNLASEKRKLERSNGELEQFASIAAHDLRAPLTSMLGWVGILDKTLPFPRESRTERAITFISASIKKADALIGDLLQVARINESTLRREKVDLKKIVEDVFLLLKENIEETGADFQVEGPLPLVFGCPSHIESIFTNFLRNALNYRDKSRPLKVVIRCRTNSECYEVAVQDNGIGIETQYTSRIFEMFSRLHNDVDHPGTGIGLAFCKKVVELYGGKIWVESTWGEGSTFFFTIPMRMAEEFGS